MTGVYPALVLRRAYSVPEHISMFAAGAAAVGSVYPTLMRFTHGHGLPCPLRTLTGVPCPFCGMTTATVSITHGDWAGAGGANPLVYLVAALLAVTAPVMVARAAGLTAAPKPWPAAAKRRTVLVLAGVVAMSWLFQLHRFGFL
ncbi:MAG TPA: DUF2752 domain-containing protein [Streptosporangiaceae bacterium]|nr:DUF2752 domain-containing protein [Streptosporangiaceae bacterium]